MLQGGSWVGQIVYRTLFLAVTITYSISLFQRFGGTIPSFYVMLRMESFQYGALGLLWLVSRYHWIKIVPFFGYSVLQASDYIATELQPGTPRSKKIVEFQKKYIQEITDYIAWANLAILLRIAIEVITIRRGSGVAALAYSLFFRIRLAYSPSQAKVLYDIKQFIDTKMEHPKVPAKIKEQWAGFNANAQSYDMFELDPKKAKAKAEMRKKALLEDREAAKQARETFQREVQANGSASV